MKDISENIDLSKKALDIDIDSSVFEEMKSTLDCEIKRVLHKVYNNEFEAGEITLKLSITIPETYKFYPCEHPVTHEMIEQKYMYRKPIFEYKTSTALKKQYKAEGKFEEERELKEIDGEFVAVPLENPQMSMFDEN